MNYNNPDFYRRSENFFPKKDNSAILRRALSKKYKEDTSKNLNNNEEINNDKEINEENYHIRKYNNYTYKNKFKNNNEDNINTKSNNNKKYFNTYMTQKNNFNTRGIFYNKKTIQNDPNIKEALLERMNIKNKYILNANRIAQKYYTSNISDDNIYQEFIINYNTGMNQDNTDNNKQNNSIDRKKTNPNIMHRKNKIYNRVALNNGIYKIDKKSFNNINNISNYKDKENKKDRIEFFNSTYQPNIPYQRRKIVDFTEKEMENGMPDKIKKELYFKNNRNNFTNYNFFDKKINKRNAYNYNFNTYNQNLDNYDRNYNNNIYENNYNFNISQKDFINKKKNLLNNKINIEKKTNDFLEHFSEYCLQYYNRIIKQLFSYLKKVRENAITRKYMIIPHKNRPIDEKNNYKSNYRNYLSKVISRTNTGNKNDINNERNNFNKSTDLLIDRIRYNNKSKSPDKINNNEMFRDIKELSKKYEIINNRKSRQSYNGFFKKGNDLSFTANSVEKNKEKEKWEKNLEKERELKRIKEQKKDNINNNIINKQKPKEKKI